MNLLGSRLKNAPDGKSKHMSDANPKVPNSRWFKNRQFKKIVTTAEDIAECEYQPGKCETTYRLTILRKTLDVVRGEVNLFEDVRHFYRARSDHKNDID